MKFRVLEIAGWLLLLLGLYVFLICLGMLQPAEEGKFPRVFESAPVTFIGFLIFRGGMQLIKISVAARLCSQAQAAVDGKPATPGSARRQNLVTLSSWLP